MVDRPLVAPCVAALDPYTPGKPLAELEKELGIRGAVKLASNENPWGAAPGVFEAIRQELDSLWLYPDGAAPELTQTLSNYLGVNPNQLVLGNGSDEIIALALQTFCAAGDVVLSAEHAFLQYELFAQGRGMRVVKAPASHEVYYDLDAMGSLACAKQARLICLANPSNPTGTWFSHSSLERFFGQVGPEPVVIVDEAYFEYANASEFPRSLEWISLRPRTIVLRTFSKAWGLAGLRVGYGITSPELADFLNRLRTPFNINRLAQVAAVAALKDHEHLRLVIERTEASKEQLWTGLSQLGLHPVPSLTNFLLVETGRSGKAIYNALLAKGVIVRPMDRYEFPTKIRITAGLPQENARLLEALGEVLHEVPPFS